LLADERPFWLYASLGWVLAGSLADLALTLWGLHLGAIREGNPLIAALLAASPFLAALLKVGATIAAVWALHWAYPQRRRLVAASLALVSLATLGVLLLHVNWLMKT
jgi:membrane-associated protease RseP (regulator of RpoE activity)